jgi:hypothetical protein
MTGRLFRRNPFISRGRERCAGTEIRVQVMVDANGNVASAKAVSGHSLLRASAEQSAHSAKLKLAAAIDGVLIFNFSAQ